MVIPGGANITAAAGLTRPSYQGQTPAHSPAPAQKEDLSRRFDSFTISDSGSGSFMMAAKSRLTQEARTVTSTDAIASLREQIRSGEYQPDPRGIARKMLLMEEAV